MTAPEPGMPPTLPELVAEGRAALRAGVARWLNPYTPSCDAWRNAWWEGWDAERVEVLVERDGP